MAGLTSLDSLGLWAGEALLLPSKLMSTLGKAHTAAWSRSQSPGPRFCMGMRGSCWTGWWQTLLWGSLGAGHECNHGYNTPSQQSVLSSPVTQGDFLGMTVLVVLQVGNVSLLQGLGCVLCQGGFRWGLSPGACSECLLRKAKLDSWCLLYLKSFISNTGHNVFEMILRVFGWMPENIWSDEERPELLLFSATSETSRCLACLKLRPSSCCSVNFSLYLSTEDWNSGLRLYLSVDTVIYVSWF